jgi:hypothetical protein
MGRMYSCVFEEVAVTAVQDLFEINASADAVVVLHSVIVTQSSDAGDSADEQLSCLFHLGSTSGSAGSIITPNRLSLGDAVFSGTCEVNNTSQGGEGTKLHAEAFNIRGGLYYRPTPEERITLSPSDRLIIELQTAPADSLTMSGTAIIEEIGG